MRVIAVDFGFRDTKVCINDNGDNQYHKFPTEYAKIPVVTPLVEMDALAFKFEGDYYYTFEDAVRISNPNSITNFKELKLAVPILLSKLLKKFGEFDEIRLGLSLVSLDSMSEFKEHITKTLNIPREKLKVFLQGVGAQKAYEIYGENLHTKTLNSNLKEHYLLVDIGYNTVDVLQCSNKEVVTYNATGIENFGITRVLNSLVQNLKVTKQISNLTTSYLKSVLFNGTLTYKGRSFDVNKELQDELSKYFQLLISELETRFNDVIAMSQAIVFVGGGGAILHKYKDTLEILNDYAPDFCVFPKDAEYYNVFGYLHL